MTEELSQQFLSFEVQRCKVFWRICTKGTRKPKLNRIKFRLKHQENWLESHLIPRLLIFENLFLEMLSQDMERMDNMDMMPLGVLTFQLIGRLKFVVTLSLRVSGTDTFLPDN